MNSFRGRRLLEKVALLGISIAISLFLAEIILRQVFPIYMGVDLRHRIPHPVFGWALEPGASYDYRTPEATVRVTYNSEGWRDVEHNMENRLGAYRVLVLGDSFMEAYSVELNDAFHRRLEQFARDKGFDIEVINLGVGGYGTLQEYLVFSEVGKLYKPDLVLLGFYMGNDVRNNSIYLESSITSKSMITKMQPFLDLANFPSWKITESDFEGAQRRYNKAKEIAEAKEREVSWFRKLARQSVLLLRLQKVVSSIIERPLTTDQSQESHKNKLSKYFVFYGPHYCQENLIYKKPWMITKRILARLKQDVEATGSTLLVFSVPALHEVDSASMKKVSEHAPESVALCLDEAPGYGRLKNILNELDIDFVDLLPDFRKVTQDSRDDLFRRSDKHWNPKGHALAATVVGSHLLERNLLITTDAAQQGAARDR